MPPRQRSRHSIEFLKSKAAIQVATRRVNLGTHKTVELAAVAYRDAATELHGEFARLQ